MIYCFLLFNIMFEIYVLSLVIDEIRFKIFCFYKAFNLLTNRKFKGLWDILVNKFNFVAELSSTKTFILSSILCFYNTLLYVLEETNKKSIITNFS